MGLTKNLIADRAELPESLRKLESDPQLALGIAPQSAARMAAAFTIFANGGIYNDLAMAISVSENGNQIWSFTPHSEPIFQPTAFRKAMDNLGVEFGHSTDPSIEIFAGDTDTGDSGITGFQSGADTAGRALGIPGTIGGEVSAWYSGYDAGIVTSVDVWDAGLNARHRIIRQSLRGVNGVQTGSSARWPANVWLSYMKTLTSGATPSVKPTSGGTGFVLLPANLSVQIGSSS